MLCDTVQLLRLNYWNLIYFIIQLLAWAPCSPKGCVFLCLCTHHSADQLEAVQYDTSGFFLGNKVSVIYSITSNMLQHAAASAPAVDAHSTLNPLWKRCCLLSTSVIHMSTHKHTFLFFITFLFGFIFHQFFQTKLFFCCVQPNIAQVVKKFNMHHWTQTSRAFKNTLAFSCFSGCAIFLAIKIRPCAPWTSSKI